MPRQKRDVIRPLLKARNLNGEYIEPVVEVFTKTAGRDVLLQVTIRRADDTHIGESGPVLPHTLVSFFLQNAEKLTLQIQRYLADLIEKNGPPSAISKRPARSLSAPVKAPRA